MVWDLPLLNSVQTRIALTLGNDTELQLELSLMCSSVFNPPTLPMYILLLSFPAFILVTTTFHSLWCFLRLVFQVTSIQTRAIEAFLPFATVYFCVCASVWILPQGTVIQQCCCGWFFYYFYFLLTRRTGLDIMGWESQRFERFLYQTETLSCLKFLYEKNKADYQLKPNIWLKF